MTLEAIHRPSHLALVTGARTWDDEARMKRAFNDLWLVWGPDRVTAPVLLSGACPDGADAMAERLWRAAGFDVVPVPADWQRHGRAAGLRRNQKMVDLAAALARDGVEVACVAFCDLCRRPGCRQVTGVHQLAPDGPPGHFSHGTAHCRNAARDRGLVVVDVLHPSVPPF